MRSFRRMFNNKHIIAILIFIVPVIVINFIFIVTVIVIIINIILIIVAFIYFVLVIDPSILLLAQGTRLAEW